MKLCINCKHYKKDAFTDKCYRKKQISLINGKTKYVDELWCANERSPILEIYSKPPDICGVSGRYFELKDA